MSGRAQDELSLNYEVINLIRIEGIKKNLNLKELNPFLIVRFFYYLHWVYKKNINNQTGFLFIQNTFFFRKQNQSCRIKKKYHVHVKENQQKRNKVFQ